MCCLVLGIVGSVVGICEVELWTGRELLVPGALAEEETALAVEEW
jgi:hypothetical protein